MTLRQRWVAICDVPGCTARLVHEPISDGDKWDYGVATIDAGWDAGLGRDETCCPGHWSEACRNELFEEEDDDESQQAS